MVELKRRLFQFIDKLFTLFYVALVIGVLWVVMQITSIATFKIPSDSMEPALLAGDNIVVNKWIMGGRLFNLWDAADHKDINISRLPGFGKISHNDMLVFNFPYPAAWDSIGMNLMTYYVKRCVGLPGDTLEIRNAHYQVRGCSKPLGNQESQDALSALLTAGQTTGVVMKGYPYNDVVEWDIEEFGPLYIPAKGGCITMDPVNYALYKNIIEWEQKQKLVQGSGLFKLGNEPLTAYRFLHNYYFVAGDKVTNSQDSRYWGLLPEDYVVGKASFIWKSKEPVTGKIRWKRIFKAIE